MAPLVKSKAIPIKRTSLASPSTAAIAMKGGKQGPKPQKRKQRQNKVKEEEEEPGDREKTQTWAPLICKIPLLDGTSFECIAEIETDSSGKRRYWFKARDLGTFLNYKRPSTVLVGLHKTWTRSWKQLNSTRFPKTQPKTMFIDERAFIKIVLRSKKKKSELLENCLFERDIFKLKGTRQATRINWMKSIDVAAVLGCSKLNTLSAKVPSARKRTWGDLSNSFKQLSTVHRDRAKGDSFIVSWGFFKEGSRADLVQTSKTSVYTLRMDKKLISSYIANKTIFIISLEWSVTTNISLPMTVEANLEVSEPGFPKEEVRLRSVLQLSSSCSSLPKLTYASQIELSPGLSSLARLAYPNRTRDFASTLANVSFHSVLPSELTSPFSVTEKAGIIYLDENRISQYQFPNFTGVLIEWRMNDSLLEVSWVPVMWNPPSSKSNTCESAAFRPGLDHPSDFQCSALESKKECQTTCGLGASASRGGFCSWITPSKYQKTSNASKKSFKISYTTCSTDKTFCPDGLCDPLEQLGELRNVQICPQDCTESVLFANLDVDDNRGINQSSKGLCTCDQLGSCHCSHAINLPPAPKDPDRMGKVSSRQELQRDDSGPKASCDGSCLAVLLTVGTSVSLILVLMSAYFCKKTRSSCGNQHKSEMNYNSTYGTEALILSDVTVIEPHHQIEIDDRWEIPRCCLSVEECLGEGEFGRVLRGTALDLKNYPGYTTVAVKTLKDNAGSAELSDLLSEYQLLKKVDHKNVIKLLGACVSPGGPIYVIIEYCALGSLRAYLRLHRNLKTSADMGARIPENSSMITPKDVLSFAYQISKGMAYLADIKLVHRDLAARNVLIAEGKICKISDFGLTRDVYEDDTYLKQSRGRVPVKWMAIESLSDHIYTTQSDVWSFGIVLWELVTLGASPYPGVTIQNLYHLLKNGYRMQKPLNCTTELYEVMRECWCEKPDDRPTFTNLVEKFGRMLERGLDYVNFSIQMISNPSYFNPPDVQDDENINSGMNITFKMELSALQENNNRYENYSVGPDTSYDTPRPTEPVLTGLIRSEHNHPLLTAQRT